MALRLDCTPPEIGSAAWDEELALVGVPRPAVDALFAAATEGLDWERATAFDVDFRPGSHADATDLPEADWPALQGICWVLYHQRRPEYASLLNLRLEAWHAAASTALLRGWIVRQYAAMLVHGPEAVRTSVGYHLWVDPFETDGEADLVFPVLCDQVPPEAWGPLLKASGPVPWETKRAVYRRALARPALHEALKGALLSSFFDYYGKVDAPEARELAEGLALGDDDASAALREVTQGPLLVFVTGAGRRAGAAGFAFEGQARNRLRFVAGSEVWLEGALLGTVAHADFPTAAPPPEGWCLAPEPRPEGLHAQAFVWDVAGPSEGAAALPGRVVELWPPGLRERTLLEARKGPSN